jgi:hypothetical protein
MVWKNRFAGAAVLPAMFLVMETHHPQSRFDESATCRAALELFVGEVASNYAGFADKVTGANRNAYDDVVARALKRTDSVATRPDCVFGPMQDWLRFFRDGHLSAGYVDDSPANAPAARVDTAEVRRRFAGWPRRNISEEYARTIAGGPIKGVWQTADGRYRVAIVPDPDSGLDNHYDAVILRADSVWWLPGQVKARLAERGQGRYTATYYMQDHSDRTVNFELTGGVLQAPGFTLIRDYPAALTDAERERFIASLARRIAVQRLDAETVLLQISSFDDSYTGKIDSIAGVLRSELPFSNLIIDLRNNGGGLDHNFQWLLPILYTGPINFISAAIYVTPANLDRMRAIATRADISDAQRSDVQSLVSVMAKQRTGYMPRKNSIYQADSVMTYPKRIAVVIDEGCASTCEEFVLAARQSGKVTLYGTHTAGILDYANVFTAKSADGHYELHYPISRSQRLPGNPVDPEGIAASIAIPSSELFPIDWISRHMQSAGSRLSH